MSDGLRDEASATSGPARDMRWEWVGGCGAGCGWQVTSRHRGRTQCPRTNIWPPVGRALQIIVAEWNTDHGRNGGWARARPATARDGCMWETARHFEEETTNASTVNHTLNHRARRFRTSRRDASRAAGCCDSLTTGTSCLPGHHHDSDGGPGPNLPQPPRRPYAPDGTCRARRQKRADLPFGNAARLARALNATCRVMGPLIGPQICRPVELFSVAHPRGRPFDSHDGDPHPLTL